MKLHYYIICAFYCAGIFWLSGRPIPQTPGLEFDGVDKLAHAVVFGGLALIVSVGLRRSNEHVRPWVQYVVPFAVAALYGVVDELHQAFVPWRTADIWDLAADTAGALAVQLALCRFVWRIPLRTLRDAA